MSEMIDLEVEFVRESDAAILVNDGTIEDWLPKSQIEYNDRVQYAKGDVVEIECPEWLAIDKEFV